MYLIQKIGSLEELQFNSKKPIVKKERMKDPKYMQRFWLSLRIASIMKDTVKK